MAIIGQSKHKDLFQRISEDGSKYRELTYADLGYSRLEEPILHGYLPEDLLEGNATSVFRKEGVPPVEQKRLSSTELKSEVLLPAITRIDDTERITRLITRGTPQGIKWEVHNAELLGIQKQLDSKRGQLVSGGTEKSGFWQNVGQGLLAAGASLVDAAKITAETLGQVAVAGTGEHLSIWQDRAYIRKGGAEFALSGGNIEPVIKDPEGTPYLRSGSQQIPDTENLAIRKAQTPKHRGVALIDTPEAKLQIQESTDIPGQKQISWNNGNAYGREKNNYIQEVAVEKSAKRFARNVNRAEEATRDGYELSDEGLSEARKPGYGESGIKFEENLKQQSFDKEGLPFVGTGSIGKNRDTESESYIKRMQIPVSASVFVLDKNGVETATATSLNNIPLGSDPVGPWKSEGPLTLLAGTTNKASLRATSPVGDDGSHKNMEGTTNGTRVDNGRIDLIPFWIRALTANGEVLDMAYLFFEANLDSYSDNYTGTWEGTQYVGRADKFWTYTGFDRQIDFSFKVVAHSKAHLKPIYNRLNGLLSMTAPTYQNGVFMQGVLAEVTIGDLLDKQLGFIKSVSLKWETDYMWETDGETIRVPHALNASVSFTPIHQFVPQIKRRYFNLVGDVKKPDVNTFITSKEKLYRKK